MVFVQLRYLFGNLKCVAQYDYHYRLNLRTVSARQIAVLQLSDLFQTAGAGDLEDLEIVFQDGRRLSAPAWPYDLYFGERQNTPP